MTDEVRLQKYLSQSGRASRREAERLMLAGRVTVNGEVARTLGVKVRPGVDRVAVDGLEIGQAERRWIAFHKPAGVLTTRGDPHGGDNVYDRLPADAAGLFYVGRLDRDTEGLLLLTNDGEAAHGLQHPSREVEREYVATVVGFVGAEAVGALVRGVTLDDGPARAKSADVVEAKRARSTVRLVLTEGRKREVRRMLEAIGHRVVRLRRLRFGPIRLGDLPPGAVRDLTADEVEAVREASRAGS